MLDLIRYEMENPSEGYIEVYDVRTYGRPCIARSSGSVALHRILPAWSCALCVLVGHVVTNLAKKEAFIHTQSKLRLYV